MMPVSSVHPQDKRPTTEGCILLVDDNADDRILFQLACKKIRLKHRIEVARDGQEALARLSGKGVREHSESSTPLLIILDLKMPRVGGLDVLRTLRADKRTRHLMAVIFSASDKDRDRASAADLGATIYLNKPLDWEGYLETATRISKLLAHL